MYYNRPANNVLFNYVTPNQQQQYYYQLPYYGYQQQNLQPVRYVYQPQPKITSQPINYVRYYPQYAQQPVCHQKIQYKPVVQQKQAVQPYYCQYPQQNVKKITKNEIDEINRAISEVKMAMKQKRLRFAGDSKWLNNLQGIDDKGNLIMTSNPVERNPIDDLMQSTYARLAEQEAVDELQKANEYKRKYLDKLPLSESYILDEYGNKYKPLNMQRQTNMVNYYTTTPNTIYNVPVRKYVNYNGMYYCK